MNYELWVEYWVCNMRKMIKFFGFILKEHFVRFKLRMKIKKHGNY